MIGRQEEKMIIDVRQGKNREEVSRRHANGDTKRGVGGCRSIIFLLVGWTSRRKKVGLENQMKITKVQENGGCQTPEKPAQSAEGVSWGCLNSEP